MLEQIFDSIANNEINMRAKGDPDKKGNALIFIPFFFVTKLLGWIRGIKAGAYEQGRRWMCLIGNELRWYKSPTMGKGDVPVLGKIVLDYVMIKESDYQQGTLLA